MHAATIGAMLGAGRGVASRAGLEFVGTAGTRRVHPMTALVAGAHAVAAGLAARRLRGRRVLVLGDAGPPYATAVLGCLVAGAVAVPLRPRRHGGLSPAQRAAITDADPSAAIVSAPRHAAALSRSGFPTMSVLDLAAGAVPSPLPPVDPDALALLQYDPSRSDGVPLGVMLTQENLAAGVAGLRRRLGVGPRTGVVCALPPHHDMGLFAGLLLPVLAGCRVTLLDEDAVLASPALLPRLVAARSARIGVASAAVYRHCADGIAGAELAGLDLSTWEVALAGGAAPSSGADLTAFADRLAGQGFRRSARYAYFAPPEAGPLVAGGTDAAGTVFDADTLAPGRRPLPAAAGTEVVDCGAASGDLDIAIVDPLTRTPCPDGTAGEIWVSGPTVAAGYFGRPHRSDRTFGARLRGGLDSYLRTGMLGFHHDGGLHVTELAADAALTAV